MGSSFFHPFFGCILLYISAENSYKQGPDPVFLPGTGSGFQISLVPDPFSVIEFRVPDPNPRSKSVQKLLQKLITTKKLKDIKENNFVKIVIKKMKRFHDRGFWIRDPDPV